LITRTLFIDLVNREVNKELMGSQSVLNKEDKKKCGLAKRANILEFRYISKQSLTFSTSLNNNVFLIQSQNHL